MKILRKFREKLHQNISFFYLLVFSSLFFFVFPDSRLDKYSFTRKQACNDLLRGIVYTDDVYDKPSIFRKPQRLEALSVKSK